MHDMADDSMRAAQQGLGEQPPVPCAIGADDAALSRLLKVLLARTDTWVVVVNDDLRVQTAHGHISVLYEDLCDQPVTLQVLNEMLGDSSVQADVRSAFAGHDVQPLELCAGDSGWLRRDVAMLDGSPGFAVITYRDITKEKSTQILLEGQKLTLQSIAQRQPLNMILDGLVRFVEKHTRPGIKASLLLLDEDEIHLRHATSPSLPASYTEAIDGMSIGPRVGSCGTAAYRREPVIVSDIATDPLWDEFREIALEAGLQACWSHPIFSSAGKVLGTFAIYCEHPAAPAPNDVALIDMVVSAAAMAIEHARNETQIRFQSLLLANVREAVIASDLRGTIIYWSQSAETLFGYSAEEAYGMSLHSFLDLDALRAQIAEQGIWTGELYYSHRSGRTVHAETILSMIVDDDGRARGYVGIVHDITGRSAAESRTLEQSRRHKSVADLGRLALSEDDLQKLMDETVRVLSETLDVPLCKILELQADGKTLRLCAGIGWSAGLVGTASVSAGQESQAGFTLLSAAPIIVDDLRKENRFSGPPLLLEHGVVSGMSVIIPGPGNTPFGVLGAHTTEARVFIEQDVNYFKSVANVLAAAIRRDAVEKSLRQSEKQFRYMANAIPKIVWSADANGVADYFNERWYACSGQAEDSRGDNAWRAILHPEDASAWHTLWYDCVATGRPFELEYRFYDALVGGYRWHLGRAVPVRDAAGTVYRWYGSSTDIDDQKRTQHQLRAQTHTLQMINWINNTLASQLDLEILSQTVIDVGTKLIGAQFGVFLYGDGGPAHEGLRLYAVSGIKREELGDFPVYGMAEIFDAEFGDGNVLCSADITLGPRYGGNTPPFNGVLPEAIAVRSYCVARVVSRTGGVLGGMFFGHAEAGVFAAGATDLIKGLAAQAAIAVDNARLYRALSDSEDQARRQLEQINAIYATAPVGLCFLDAELCFKSMNEHLAQMACTTIRNVNGMTLAEVLGDAAAELEPHCREAMSMRLPVLDREICWRISGTLEVRHWLCSCYPIQVDGDELLGVNTVVQDITARKQSELELAHLAEIVAGSYDAIITETLDGTITSWNGGAESLFGYRADEMVGRNIDILLPGDHAGGSAYILAALHNGGRMRVEEAVRIRKGGRPVDVSITVSPIHDAAGELIGVSTIERDITLRKQTEAAIHESEARMRFILHASRVGTWDWDVASGTVQWSDNLETLHGRPTGTFGGTFESVLMDVHPDDVALIHNEVARAMEGAGDYHVEYRVRFPDGRVHWVEGKGQVIRDATDVAVRMAGICMDITERKEAEEALRISESMLRNKADELATAHRQKDEFLAMLAHELRNPLAPVSNAVQLLKMQNAQQQYEYVPWAVDVIDRQVGQITRLVDDLLDVARITRGRIELKKELVGVADIVRQAVETVTPLITTKQHILDVRYPSIHLQLNADPTRMIQAISNLLNNAAKFTSEGGKIVLSVTHDRDEMVLRVSDNGVGISPEVLPHVFDLFIQADRSLDRRQGGLGLGLSLVKRLVEKHGGRVAAFSAGIGRGSEFVMWMPLASPACPQSQQRQSIGLSKQSGDGRGLHILVVDDNAESAEAMAILLRTVGHEVETAYDGQTAIDVARERPPDVLFLDIGLPIIDGYEVACRLREIYGNDLLLVALTGYTQNPDDERVQKARFDHYLLKPVAFDHLQSLLTEYKNRLRA